MRQRTLLIAGIAALAAAVVVGVSAAAIGTAGSPVARPGWTMGGMMGGVFGSGGGDIGIDRAVGVARGIAASYPGGGLAVDEVIEFSNGYYASIREKSTGIGAFEILIDRSTGAVTREPGPDMMWNTRYGMATGGMTGGAMMRGGGMMGGAIVGGGYAAAGPMSVTSNRARDIAQAWLDANQPGSRASTADPFYGYYTIDFEKGGRLAGMLSVNGYSGAVWYHSWHGGFVQMRDLGE